MPRSVNVMPAARSRQMGPDLWSRHAGTVYDLPADRTTPLSSALHSNRTPSHAATAPVKASADISSQPTRFPLFGQPAWAYVLGNPVGPVLGVVIVMNVCGVRRRIAGSALPSRMAQR